jgi:hypothetical protein
MNNESLLHGFSNAYQLAQHMKNDKKQNCSNHLNIYVQLKIHI